MLNKTILVTGCAGSLENLKQLKDEDKIEFQGSPKTGGYVVK